MAGHCRMGNWRRPVRPRRTLPCFDYPTVPDSRRSPDGQVPSGQTYQPTGNDAKAEIAAVFTIQNGLTEENLEYYDCLGLTQKVGLIFA
jgi:hypothetical protein